VRNGATKYDSFGVGAGLGSDGAMEETGACEAGRPAPS
jgi:hypothetical protein